MKILVLLGLPLSGKTSHAQNIDEYFDFEIPLVETGPFVYKAVEEKGVETTPENIKKIVKKLKEEEGDAIFTVKAINYINSNFSKFPIILLSGVKARSELDVLIKEIGEDNVFLVSFHASFNTRYSRLLNKDRQNDAEIKKKVEDQAMADDPKLLKLRDDKELSYGLGELMALAHYVVNTENRLWPHKNFDETLNDFKTIITDIIK